MDEAGLEDSAILLMSLGEEEAAERAHAISRRAKCKAWARRSRA